MMYPLRPLVFFLALAAPAAAAKEPIFLVICAPSYPGSTAEAQATIDALTAAMSQGAKLGQGELAGAYFETEKGGIARLGQPDASIAIFPLALFLEQRTALGLTPRLGASLKGRVQGEVWSLVAKKGALKDAASLDGWQLGSLVAFSPRFVKGPALGAWGKLPANVSFVQTSQILSLLRKAVAGEKIALLLDSEQAASIAALPFAADLEVVYTSPPLPAAVVSTVGKRLPDARWKPFADSLPRLGDTPDGQKALDAVWKLRFLPLDKKAIGAAEKAFLSAP